MVRQTRFWFLFGCLVGLVFLTACGNAPVIGVVLPESGFASPYGESVRNAIEIGLQHAEEDGVDTTAVALVWADSASDPETAGAETRRLAKEEHAKIVLAAVTSDEAEEVVEALEDTMAVGLTPTASRAELTRKSQLFYRIFASDDLEGRRAGQFLAEEKKADTVLVVTSDSVHAQGLEPPFRQMFVDVLEGEISGRISLKDAGWQDALTDALATSRPDGIYLITYADQAKQVLTVLRGARFEGPVCGTSAINSRRVIAEAPELFDAVFFPQPDFDLAGDKPHVQRFVAAYRETYGTDPDIFAAHAYDSIRIALQVATSVEMYETPDIRKGFNFGVTEYPGVTGYIQFNDFGDVQRNPIMYFVKDGDVRNYEKYLDDEKARIREEIRKLLMS